MPFLSSLKKVFNFGLGNAESTKKRVHHNLQKDVNPEDFWIKTKELGDGAFGKVYLVSTQMLQ